jgi:hypothetical protein
MSAILDTAPETSKTRKVVVEPAVNGTYNLFVLGFRRLRYTRGWRAELMAMRPPA